MTSLCSGRSWRGPNFSTSVRAPQQNVKSVWGSIPAAEGKHRQKQTRSGVTGSSGSEGPSVQPTASAAWIHDNPGGRSNRIELEQTRFGIAIKYLYSRYGSGNRAVLDHWWSLIDVPVSSALYVNRSVTCLCLIPIGQLIVMRSWTWEILKLLFSIRENANFNHNQIS